jgi:HEAT repeat protein
MKKIPFQTVLEQLKDESRPFPATSLHRLADLQKGQARQIAHIWPTLSDQRRINLLEDMETITDSDDIPSFAEIAHIALKDPHPAARALAIRLLWQAEDPQLVPIFSRMLTSDPDLEVRAQAASALSEYVYLAELEELPENLRAPLEALLLETAQNNPEPLLRRRAIEALGFSSRPEVPNLIQQAYEQTTPEWIESALFAMGRSADEERWQEAILTMFEHPNPQVVLEAVRAAGELELTKARQPLLQLLESNVEDFELRRFTIYALSKIGGEGVLEALQKAYEAAEEDDDEEELFFLEEALDNLQMAFLLGDNKLIGFDFLESTSSTQEEIDEEELSEDE